MLTRLKDLCRPFTDNVITDMLPLKSAILSLFSTFIWKLLDYYFIIKGYFTGYGILDWQFGIFALKNVVPLPSGFHGFL